MKKLLPFLPVSLLFLWGIHAEFGTSPIATALITIWFTVFGALAFATPHTQKN